MHKKSLPLNIIQDAAKDKNLDTLVYFLWLRSIFKKPIFYNYNVRKIAYHLNISPTTASKHIQIMIKLGWARIDSGHLCLVSIDKLILKKSPMVLIPIIRNKKSQLIQLRYATIKNNLDQQVRQIKKKTATVAKAKRSSDPISTKQLRTISKVGGLKKYEKSLQKDVTLSNKRIGKFFSRSQSTGMRYQKQFRQERLIKSQRRFKKVEYDPFHTELGRIRQYLKNGKFYTQLSNRIIPMIIPPITKANALVVV